MPSTNYNIIRTAILNKQQVTATYKGHIRKMCPHVIGLAKDGTEQALFYQFGGTSGSKAIDPNPSKRNWRCIPIEGLSKISVQSGTWYTEGTHSQTQTCVDKIDIKTTN
jgi:hypothetical protein